MECNVLIIEDHREQSEALERLVKKVNANATVYFSKDEKEAYSYVMEKDIHVFIVDIILHTNHSSDTSGIKFVEKVREIPRYLFSPVIFITALEDSELYAYRELNCYSYIEKPFSEKQVIKVLEKALQFPKEIREEKTIFFRKDGIIYPVKTKDVVYFEFHDRKVIVHMLDSGKKEFPYITVKKILEETGNGFIQCSRTVIVNERMIENIDFTNDYIKMSKIDELIEIGKSFRKKMMERYKI